MATNKVVFGNQTVMDISDSTLSSTDEIVEGVTAYDRSGVKLTGTAPTSSTYMQKVSNPTANDILVTDANGQAIDSGVQLSAKQDTLVSGTNIKTINNESLLGNGNISIDNVFMVTPSQTLYADILQAIDDGKVLLVAFSDNLWSTVDYRKGNNYITMYSNINPINGGQYYEFQQVNSSDEWLSGRTQMAAKADIPTLTSDLTNDGDGTSNFVTFADEATDNDFGLIKTNSNKSITLNANGQLEVGGRIGQFSGTTGLFAPDDREPRNVGNYCLMITDVKGAQMTNSRSFAVMSGLSITLKSAAAAGATEYHVSNTYANRLKCKICEGGFAAKDEATSGAEQVIPVVSVTIGGQPYTPDSSPDDSTQDIIITTEESLNPSESITGIRAVGTMGAYSTAHIGNGISSVGGGRCLLLGSGITKDGSGNECGVVAQDTYVLANGSAIFGRWHIVNKNRAFIAGQGHDTTNARAEGVSAIGLYSLLEPKHVFAVGLGASHTARKNVFEVTAEHGGTARSNFIEAKNAKLEFASEEDIIPEIEAGNWSIGSGGSIQNFDGVVGFATTDVKGRAVNITVATRYAMPVTAGETLTWSFTVRKRTGRETGKFQLNLLKCNADGGSASNNVVKDGTAASYSTEWTTYTGTFTIPSGMEFILPRVSRTNTGAGSTGGYDIKDITITRQVDSGIILTSPNGIRFKISVDNSGNLSTTPV